MTYKAVRKPIKCPACQEKTIAEILYGCPADSPELRARLEEGTLVLGGCCVCGFEPKWECTSCGIQIYHKSTILPDE